MISCGGVSSVHPSSSRQHAFGRAHNSVLEMEESALLEAAPVLNSVYLESNGGLSSVFVDVAREAGLMPQRMGWRRS